MKQREIKRQELDSMMYQIISDYRMLHNLPIEVEDNIYDIQEIRKEILFNTESVPEQKFCDALFSLLCQLRVKVSHGWMSNEELEELEKEGAGYTSVEMMINPQMLINKGKIRPDVAFRKGSNNIIVFEIDSFQYHSNQQQLMSDKKRERKIQSLGYPVFRFSAKEILDDPLEVAIEATHILKERGFIDFNEEQYG